MSFRPASAPRGVVPGQVAEIIVSLPGGAGRRGSGYRVGPIGVLTAAHVIEGAVLVRVRFDADLPGEWITVATSCWTDLQSDLAVLTIAPRDGEPPVTVTRFGRIGDDRAAVLTAQAVGFPRFKLKNDDGNHLVYRDSHQADGSVAVLSNRRERTLEVTVPAPEQDPDPEASPWEGMSGAALWVGDRIVGVIAKHHPADGLGRLAAARLDLAFDGLDPDRHAELRMWLDLPEVLPDVVPPSTAEWLTSAYQAQARDIAPDCLLDRDAELDELVRFCAGDQPYAWWQAGPWAGKSALMSWFVLHPPAKVDVVSFFVTARLDEQSDSDACTSALIEQLAALVGESPAGLLTVGAQRGTMLRLLENAAGRAREVGHRLLLVIDGLDEDRSADRGRSSIAALLPRRPPPEVRVLVASRPLPPIPCDVADDHPLRVITPVQLAVSAHAREMKRRAELELRQLLKGSPLERDVLGLITAAGGGLTQGDLQELTQQPSYEIGDLLLGLFGRSIGSRLRSSPILRADEQVHLFTHETLRVVAEQQYGNSLILFRDRLHNWADSYRERGWPADTPLYLLGSYPRMLASTKDLARLVSCTTDQARHDRMRSLSGGDALALTEISTAQRLLLAQSDPDLTSLALIAVERDHLAERNANVPTNLPAVWAKLGQPARAEALAHSILDSNSRTTALGLLAKVVAAGGNPDRAETLVGEITNLDLRAEILIQLAEVVATGRDTGRLGGLVEGTAASIDPDRAARLANEAEELITHVTNPDRRAELLIKLAKGATASGDPAWVLRLAGEAEAFVAQTTSPESQTKTVSQLATVVAACGDLDWAETLVARITDQDPRLELLIQLAKVATVNDDLDRAERLIHEAEVLIAQITDPVRRAVPLGQLVMAVATYGDLDRAEALSAEITEPDSRSDALAELAETAVASGDLDRAEALIAQIPDLDLQPYALGQIVGAAVASGDLDRAKAVVAQITDPYLQTEVLGGLAEDAVVSGDPELAAALSSLITNPASKAKQLSQRPETAAARDDHKARIARFSALRRAAELTRLAEVQIRSDPERAARLAGEAEEAVAQIPNHGSRVESLGRLAEAVAISGDPDRAAWLIGEAEALIAQIADPESQAEAWGKLVESAVASGDLDRSEAFVAQVADPDSRAEAVGRLAEAVASRGDLNRAEALIARISKPGTRARALSRVALVIARHQHEKTLPVREYPHGSSPMLFRARHLLGEALATGSWTDVAPSLGRLDPPAINALTDELQTRWQLDGQADPARSARGE